MSKKATTAAKPSIYETVTERIIASLRAGVIPWEKPWQTPHFSGGPFPRNFRTGKPYRGINVFLLWASPYSSPFWLTFKQAQELKGSVRKGEKGTQIVFYKQLRDRRKNENAEDEEKERAPSCSATTPFSTWSNATALHSLRSSSRPPKPSSRPTKTAKPL